MKIKTYIQTTPTREVLNLQTYTNRQVLNVINYALSDKEFLLYNQ